MQNLYYLKLFSIFCMGTVFNLTITSAANLPDSVPKGWRTGSGNPPDIVIGTDTLIRHSGKSSGFLQRALALTPSTGNVTLMQSIAADAYRNKRVRLTVYARSKEVESGAFFYFRVDGEDTVFAYKNTAVDLIRETTEWGLYNITLDVPEAAVAMDFGVVMSPGQGTIWMDDFNLEVVDNLIPSGAGAIRGQSKNPGTKKHSIPNAKAMNLGFEDR